MAPASLQNEITGNVWLEALEADGRGLRGGAEHCDLDKQYLLQRRNVSRRNKVSPERLRDVDFERPAMAWRNGSILGSAEMNLISWYK